MVIYSSSSDGSGQGSGKSFLMVHTQLSGLTLNELITLYPRTSKAFNSTIGWCRNTTVWTSAWGSRVKRFKSSNSKAKKKKVNNNINKHHKPKGLIKLS